MEHSKREVMRLMKDSQELEMMRREVADLSWRNSQLERQVLALKAALVLCGQEESAINHLLKQISVEVCACGHIMSDHDKNGCQWLQCKSICG